MTDRTPPKLATALLNCFVDDPNALAGDLAETYQPGRSPLWYWREVIAAIFMGASRDCHRQKLTAAGTFVAAVILIAIANRTLTPVSGWLLYRVVQPAAWAHPVVAAHGLVALWIIEVVPSAMAALLGGWLVGRVNRSRRGLVLLFLSGVFACLLSLWTVIAVRALSSPGKHMPPPDFALFVAGQVLFPTSLAFVASVKGIGLESSRVNGSNQNVGG